MTKGTRNNLVILGIIALLVGAFFAIGGGYGLVALVTGKNPAPLIRATPANTSAARQNGELVAKAIEFYMLEKKEYPQSLQDLVDSKFIESYPQSGIGDNQFKYKLDPQKGFVLEYFIGPNYQKDWYEGAAAKWFSDQ